MASTGSAFTSLKGKLWSAAFALLLTSAVIPSAHAQHPDQAVPAVRRWTLSALLEVLHAGKDSWGVGPTLGIRRDFGPKWGMELRAALPAFNGSGGAAIDLAATYTAITRTTELGASLGATGFLVGDQSELTGGGVGLYAAAHATGWLTRGFGVTGGANLRTAVGTFPGAFAGLALRF
jgi:hypothetical protein